MNKHIHRSEYFFGNKISHYGLAHGRVDYASFSKAFDSVLNNSIFLNTPLEDWDVINGNYFDENGELVEIFQYYIVSAFGAKVIKDYTEELLIYNGNLEIYLWCIKHYGTAWDYTLTDIPVYLHDEDLPFDNNGTVII